MDTAEKAADPFAFVAVLEIGPVSAAAWKNREAKPLMHMQRLAVPNQRRDHRNFLGGQLECECMFLADGLVAPAPGPIKFGDQRLAVLDADLVHAVFVA